jgi:hypothetical protein
VPTLSLAKYMLTLVAAIAVIPSVQATGTNNLCHGDETVVFSCAYGKKFASVCSSSTPDGTLRYVQYRFGKVSRPEIAVPQVGRFTLNTLRGENFSGTHGGGEVLSIENGDYRYQVLTSWDIHGDTYDSTSIRVLKNGAQISHFSCEPRSELGRDDQGLRALISKNQLRPLEKPEMPW